MALNASCVPMLMLDIALHPPAAAARPFAAAA